MNSNEKTGCQLTVSVRTTLDRNISAGRLRTILAAVSGGQDSCAMLHALAGLSAEYGYKLHSAHLNHGFRGEDAAEDARFVAEFSSSLGIPCTVEYCDVPAMANRLRLSAQEAARNARHDFLERTADRIGANWIALGHTRDDHIETILLNIVRGTGTDGLKGLAETSGRIIRPLILAGRGITSEYCMHRGIPFREDITNSSPKYLRNRVRAELLPLMETYYNPAIRDALARLSKISFDESEYVEGEAASHFDDVVSERTESRLVFSLHKLQRLGPALSRRILRQAIADIRGNLRDVEFETIEKVLQKPEDANAISHSFPLGDAAIEARGDSIIVRKVRLPSNPLTMGTKLAIPGETTVHSLGISVKAQYCSPTAPFAGGNMAVMDQSALKPPLLVRNRKNGDRIEPLGLGGVKKLQDVMVDRKIPSELRNRIPIITDMDGPIWVVGHVLSERVKIRPGTSMALEMVVSPLADPFC